MRTYFKFLQGKEGVVTFQQELAPEQSEVGWEAQSHEPPTYQVAVSQTFLGPRVSPGL